MRSVPLAETANGVLYNALCCKGSGDQNNLKIIQYRRKLQVEEVFEEEFVL